VDPERLAAFITSRHHLILASLCDEGCLEYVIAADAAMAGRVNLFQRWSSREAFNAHLRNIEGRRGETPSIPIIATNVKSYDVVAESTLDGTVVNAMAPIRFTARTYQEYLAMFGLREDELPESILDCPGGAASFKSHAQSNAFVVAVDPEYTKPVDSFRARAYEETERGCAVIQAEADRYVWKHFANPQIYRRQRLQAAVDFADDIELHNGTYVAASLPHLPFDDDAFHLVLSSHLLFTYGDRLDYDFHLQVARELTRVSSGEARIYPLVTHSTGLVWQEIERLRGELESEGISSRIKRVDYEFDPGANEALILERTSRSGR
jgi:hypothetical protein